jgi:16S rRNA (uracil1498-N3)-methyltransferase
MNLPYFYTSTFSTGNDRITLEEDTSLHIIQVLRMKQGEELLLTDGIGNLLTTTIINANKKAAEVKLLSRTSVPPAPGKISVAISLIKNTSRFEWFLEKATEIGISEIIPLICERTEKQHFRSSRMKNILVSAMLQSRQAWLPVLHEPLSFAKCIASFNPPTKLIAHCLPGEKNVINQIETALSEMLVLIGPEGDFTGNEIDLALQKAFVPVSLGETRLRTETAGIVAVTLLNALPV